MVWLKRIMFTSFLIVFMTMASYLPCFATVYNLSTNALTTFRDLVPNFSETSSYVAFSTGDRDYYLYFSDDLKENDDTFSCSSPLSYYHYFYSEKERGYLLSLEQAGSFNRTLNDRICYSNLGDNPHLVGKEAIYAKTILFVSCLFVCCYILRSFLSRLL